MLVFGLMIPFIGTASGAGMVLFMKKKLSASFEALLSGFAAGVMTAASVWSLLLPSIEMSGGYKLRFLPAATGFIFGFAFLIILEKAVSRLFYSSTDVSLPAAKRTAVTALAVTLHNIPEGMAVGVALAAAVNSPSQASAAAATALSVGIAIQNFPEGAIISMPLKADGVSKSKALLLGVASGAVEPLFGIITLALTGAVRTALPYLLSFAAGAMICVVVKELIPEAKTGCGSLGFAAGFVSMMILDVAFG